MENPATSPYTDLQPNLPQPSFPNPTAPPLPGMPPPAPSHNLIIAASIAIILGIGAVFGWKAITSQKPVSVAPSPTPPPTPTPTPIRVFSALSTESAYLYLDARVASLSASVKNYVVEDPSLSPPVLDLPLDFNR